jgi:hypothetical protein
MQWIQILFQSALVIKQKDKFQIITIVDPVNLEDIYLQDMQTPGN